MKKKYKKTLSILLTLTGPVLMLIYLTLDHFGTIDIWVGQDKIEIAIERLENTGGYPKNWLYNDSIDKEPFDAILRLIKKKSKLLRKNSQTEKYFKLVEEEGYPLLISIGGSPIEIKNVTETWTQQEKYFYSDNHPILFAFHASRNIDIKTTGGKVCTLGDLKAWAINRKMNILYWIMGLGFGLFTIATIILQFRIE